MVEVVVTDEFRGWYEDLSNEEQESVQRVVARLEEVGVLRGSPYSSDIKGTEYPLRELRIQHEGRPFRVFYAFDPKRQAVLLIGDDKTGKDRFYEQMLPTAEKLWREYLRQST